MDFENNPLSLQLKYNQVQSRKKEAMGIIISIIVGGIIGWIASIIMGTGHSIVMNILIGVVGSALGNWLFGDVLKIGGAKQAGSLNIPGLIFGILGSIVLLFIVGLIFWFIYTTEILLLTLATGFHIFALEKVKMPVFTI